MYCAVYMACQREWSKDAHDFISICFSRDMGRSITRKGMTLIHQECILLVFLLFSGLTFTLQAFLVCAPTILEQK